MKLAFIVNPASGKGKKTFQRFKKGIRTPFRTYMTEYTNHATKITKYLVKEAKITCIIVVGGDGTIHEVINGLNGAPMIIGVIGNGTGNDFSRYFYTFKHPKALARFINRPKTDQADLGEVKHANLRRMFVNNSGIGFDALVCERVNQSGLKPWLNRLNLGKLNYLYHFVRALSTFQPFSIKLSDGRDTWCFDRVWFVTISNQPYFGGGMKISPKADAYDQRLNVTVVHNITKQMILKLFWRVYNGTHVNYDAVEQFTSRAVMVELNDRRVAHSDGETYYLNQHFPVLYQVKANELTLVKGVKRS